MLGRDFLLDTNIASAIIKGESRAIENRMAHLPMERFAISAITEAELRYGIAKMADPRKLKALVDDFLGRVRSLPWDSRATHEYAVLRAALEKQGRKLDAEDLMIAAHALSLDATLVTHDKAFKRIPGLRLEDWSTS